ncbi:MAG: NAD(P)-binding protein [Saprospiraceae bacterium]|nr:NAD(P)-binding protein [Saprospiraceae bacterium]
MANPPTPTKKKIAILGGGLGALSTAFELTDYEGWDDHYEITLYQMGWRLGGKCATGRGPEDRIEEHGIHVFLGFYNNAMRMVRLGYEAWREMGLINPDAPFQKWEDIFHLQSSIMLPEFLTEQRRWTSWPMVFPENDLVPGIGEPPSKQVNIKKMLLIVMELILGSPYLEKRRGCVGGMIHDVWEKIFPKERMDELPSPQPNDFHYLQNRGEHPEWWADLKNDVIRETKDIEGDLETKYIHFAKRLIHDLPETEEDAGNLADVSLDIPHIHGKIAKLLEEYVIELEGKILNLVQKNDNMRRFWLLSQLGMVILKGLDADCYEPKTGTYNFDNINDLDFRDWLRKWGAKEEVIYSAPVKDIYALVFAYPKGNTFDPGQIEAGTAILGAMLIVLGYKGAVMYRFHGGTAEVIVNPIYEVLMKRGVEFKFFHKVKEVAYSDGDEIEEIVINQQIRLKDPDAAYDPTMLIKGLHCWPSHPFWKWDRLADQIHPKDLSGLQAAAINLESHWSGWDGIQDITLKKGVDFDQVVLGISKEGLNSICPGIIEKKKAWKDMMDHVQTVQTQAVQLWLKEDLKELGMDLPKLGLSAMDNPILDTYVDPINSYADMSELVGWESWQEGDKPKHIAYFCGPLLETDMQPLSNDKAWPHNQDARVREMAMQWLNDNVGFLWPLATQKTNLSGLDFHLLVDPDHDPNATGIEKLSRQFYRANIDPSERYVLSVPGSGKHRLKADGSGYKNLFLAGDWIDTGYNMGCAECAVMSGLFAAQAVRKTYGFKKHKPIFQDL